MAACCGPAPVNEFNDCSALRSVFLVACALWRGVAFVRACLSVLRVAAVIARSYLVFKCARVFGLVVLRCSVAFLRLWWHAAGHCCRGPLA